MNSVNITGDQPLHIHVATLHLLTMLQPVVSQSDSNPASQDPLLPVPWRAARDKLKE